MMHKRDVEQFKQEMRQDRYCRGIGLLVLTRTMHTHGKKKETHEGDMEARSD